MSVPRSIHARTASLLTRAAILPLLLAVACTKSEDDDAMMPSERPDHVSTPNPPYLLGEDSVGRLIGALRDLRVEYVREHPPSDPKYAGKTIAMGVGITRSIDRSAEIVSRYGFTSKDEFEQALAHVQRALSVAVMSGTRGLDGQSLRQKLDESQQVLVKELEATKRDQSLSVEARNTKIAEIEASIATYQRHLDEADSISTAIKSGNAAVPEQNVAAVTKYLDELKAVMEPIQIR